jgi:ATP-binding cassette subfamily C protein CydCD
MSRPVDPRLVRSVGPVRTLLAGLVLIQVGCAALTLLQAVALARFIGAVFGNRGGLAADLAWVLGAAAGRAVLAAGQEWFAATWSLRARAQLRGLVLRAIAGLGPRWLAGQDRGRLITAAGPGIESLDGYLTRALPAMVAASVLPPVIIAGIGYQDWQSGLILLLVLPLVGVFMALIGIVTRRHMNVQFRALAALSGRFLDLVTGLPTLKIYGQAAQQTRRLRAATDAYRQRTMATLRVAFLSGLVLDLIATLGIAVVAVDIGLRLDHGRLSLTSALIVLLLAPEFFAPLRAVGAQFHTHQAGQVAAEAALDVLDVQSDRTVVATTDRSAPIRPTGGLRLSGLTVGYPDRSEPAVRQLSCRIAGGQVVALQGRSGAGKSSVLAALIGFAETAGRIEVETPTGWRPIEAADLPEWRTNIAWLPQRPVPTQADVRAEIALGDPAASEAELSSVAELCRTPPLPTELGEDGRLVSAGQRRRIALARALLRARRVAAGGLIPLVLLDEPSEDLDVDTERVVLAVLAELAGRATVLVATHGARIAAAADQVLTLDGGRLIDSRVQCADRSDAGTPPPIENVLLRQGTAPAHRPAGRTVLAAGWLRRMTGSILLSAAAGLSGLALTATSLWLICRAAERPNIQALALAVVGVRTFALARALLRYLERLHSHDRALRQLGEVRAGVFQALIPLAPGGLAGYRRGDLLRRFVTDVDAVTEGLVRAVVPACGALITAAGAVLLAAVVSGPAALLLATGLLLAGLLVPLATRAASGTRELVAQAGGQRDAQVTAFVDGLPELAGYGALERQLAGIEAREVQLAGLSRRTLIGGALGTVAGGLASALTLAGLLVLAWRVQPGLSAIDLGVLVAATLVGFEAVSTLPAAVAAWTACTAAQGRVAEVLASSPDFDPGDCAPPTGPVGIRAQELSLAPARDAAEVLQAAELWLEPGSRTALLGPSGSGKSTVLAAVLRLRPISGGRLDLVGGTATVPVAGVAAAELPPVAAGSLQGDHVFTATLRDNLRIARPDASDAELEEAAERAGLAGFIASLPHGWSTLTGRDGEQLSGGQRQRLLLARALLADPQILVLDEPTAHLDAETEAAVLVDLLDRGRQRTVLISTHRVVPTELLDEIRLIRDGRLDEVGLVRDGRLEPIATPVAITG